MSNDITVLATSGQQVEEIPVSISYDIIHLFSEGLYQSPNKAIEELVSNSYDANAQNVHILLPEQSSTDTQITAPLWVIDDGHGMDKEGFRQLWRVAESNKSGQQATNGRPPIGQFGIGKLAAYVLAWKLTHLSRVDDKLLMTSMDFRRVTGRQADAADRRRTNGLQGSLQPPPNRKAAVGLEYGVALTLGFSNVAQRSGISLEQGSFEDNRDRRNGRDDTWDWPNRRHSAHLREATDHWKV